MSIIYQGWMIGIGIFGTLAMKTINKIDVKVIIAVI